MSNKAKILEALRMTTLGTGLSDKEISCRTGLPEPSVRRTRLDLMAAGFIVYAGTVFDKQTWRLRSWQQPNTYTGIQERLK